MYFISLKLNGGSTVNGYMTHGQTPEEAVKKLKSLLVTARWLEKISLDNEQNQNSRHLKKQRIQRFESVLRCLKRPWRHNNKFGRTSQNISVYEIHKNMVLNTGYWPELAGTNQYLVNLFHPIEYPEGRNTPEILDVK